MTVSERCPATSRKGNPARTLPGCIWQAVSPPSSVSSAQTGALLGVGWAWWVRHLSPELAPVSNCPLGPLSGCPGTRVASECLGSSGLTPGSGTVYQIPGLVGCCRRWLGSSRAGVGCPWGVWLSPARGTAAEAGAALGMGRGCLWQAAGVSVVASSPSPSCGGSACSAQWFSVNRLS